MKIFLRLITIAMIAGLIFNNFGLSNAETKKTEQTKENIKKINLTKDRYINDVGEIGNQKRWISILPAHTGILDVLPDSASSDIVYAATKNGIYKTDNRGLSWYPLSDKVVSRLYFDVNFHTVIYGIGSDGVLKSNDGGRNWTDFGAGTFTGKTVIDITQDPENPSIFYAFTISSESHLDGTHDTVIYKTLNGGKSWGKLRDMGRYSHIKSLFIDSNSKRIYFVVSEGTFYSADGGENFMKFNISIEREVMVNILGKKELQKINCNQGAYLFSFDSSSRQPIFMRCEYEPPFERERKREYLRSIDGGQSWEKVQIETTNPIERLIYDKKDKNIIYAITRDKGMLGNYEYSTGDNFPSPKIFKTTDGGKTWKTIDNLLPYGPVSTLAFAVSTQNVLYANTWRGIYKSTNGGYTWYSANIGLPSSAYYKTFISDDTKTLYATVDYVQHANYEDAEQRVSKLFKSRDGGFSWEEYPYTIGQPSAFVASEEEIYLLLKNGSLYKITNWNDKPKKINLDFTPKLMAVSPSKPKVIWLSDGKYLRRSEDGGFSWTNINFVSITAISVDNISPQIVYIAQGEKLYKTVDGGEQWMNISGDLNNAIDAFYAPLNKVIEERRKNTLTTLKRASKKPLNQSRSGFEMWQATNALSAVDTEQKHFSEFLQDAKEIISIVVSSASDDIFVTTKEGSIYKSQNNGKIWKSINKDIDAIVSRYKQNYFQKDKVRSISNINNASFDKNFSNIYIATDTGIFKSSDGGVNMHPFSMGLHELEVRQVLGDPSGLIIAETSSSIYRLGDAEMKWAKDNWDKVVKENIEYQPNPMETSEEGETQKHKPIIKENSKDVVEQNGIESSPSSKQVALKVDKVPIWSEPLLFSSIIMKAPKGTVLELLSEIKKDNIWVQVRLPDGQVGWVTKSFVK